MPWIGGLLGLLAVRAAMRRKGLMRGALDTGLNALPYVGAVKLAAESLRGRDFMKDRRAATPSGGPGRRQTHLAVSSQ